MAFCATPTIDESCRNVEQTPPSSVYKNVLCSLMFVVDESEKELYRCLHCKEKKILKCARSTGYTNLYRHIELTHSNIKAKFPLLIFACKNNFCNITYVCI